MDERDLRLLVTKECNYKCIFCHGEGLLERVKSSLSPNDYAFLFSVANKKHKINTVTITGGEPLIRKDVIELTQKLFGEGAKITLTTNGYLLGKKTEIGRYLKKVNISLHTMDPLKYEKLVKIKNSFIKLKDSIKLFREENENIKIVFNATTAKGLNESWKEINDLIDFAESINADIKFIELFPRTSDTFIPIEKLKNLLLDHDFIVVNSNHRRTTLANKKVNITLTKIFCEIAQDYEEPSKFCKSYNDLFVSPDGNIKICRNIENIIKLGKEITNRDVNGVSLKLLQALESLGEKCLFSKN